MSAKELKNKEEGNEREVFYRFLDTILDVVATKKQEVDKKKKRLTRYGKFVAFRMPEELLEGIEALTKKMKKNNSEIIREAVKEYVAEHREAEKEYMEGRKERAEDKKEIVQKYLEEHKDVIKEYLKSHEEEIGEYLGKYKEEKAKENKET